MSYCRWSSNNFDCDIYAYESDNGYKIHIATNRVVGAPPKSDYSLIMKDQTDERTEKFIEQEKVRSAWMDKCEHKPIGLPLDGESFTLDTPQGFYDQMIELREMGYRFPDYVLDEIKSEIQTQNNKP